MFSTPFTFPWNELIWIELFLFLSDWAIRLVMLVVVPRRRAPESARAWLILIFLLPWVGLVLYLVLGQRRVARQRQERHAIYQQRLRGELPASIAHTVSDARVGMPAGQSRPPAPDERAAREGMTGALPTQSATTASDTPVAAPDAARWLASTQPVLDERLQPMAALAQAMSALPLLGGNAADLLDDYAGSIDRLVTDIDGATRYVHLLYYIFADDATGERVADALLRAARRGVTCRLLADGLASRSFLRRLLPRLRAGGVQAHPIAEPGWAHLLRRADTSRLDLRNHRKIAVIDGTIGYTGSQNIVNATFKRGTVYEDVVVRVRGPVVRQLQSVFLSDWFLETHELLGDLDGDGALPAQGSLVAQTVPSGPEYSTEANQRLFVALLYSARRRIVLTTPYFVPDTAFLNALETAALRGVETHLVVSDARAKGLDQALVSQAQRAFYAELLEMGVQIHLYPAPRFLHAKHLSIDDELAVIGSSNLDRRSFALNAEVSMLFYGHDVAARMRVIEERYFAAAHLLTAAKWDNRPWWSTVAQNTARLLDALL